jgi:chaperonin GroES
MVKISPLGDRVLIEPLKNTETTKSGIVIPDTSDKRPEQGIVLEVGAGARNEDGELMPLLVKKGQKVLFSKYGPSEIKIDDKEYLIAREEDILAVIED